MKSQQNVGSYVGTLMPDTSLEFSEPPVNIEKKAQPHFKMKK